MSAGQLPPPGTVLRKIDRNGAVRCEAVVADNGQVVYRGVTYSSISAAARVAASDIGLAARSCDGYAFFGLKGATPRASRAPKTIGYAINAPLPLPLPVSWDDLFPPAPLGAPMPAVLASLSAPATSDHSRHGRANASGAPIDADCACRASTREEACAAAGCGYCRAARMAKDRAEFDAATREACGYPPAPAAVEQGEPSRERAQVQVGTIGVQPVPVLIESQAPVALPAPATEHLAEIAQMLPRYPALSPPAAPLSGGDAYREAASRDASSASTQDGIAEATELPAPIMPVVAVAQESHEPRCVRRAAFSVAAPCLNVVVGEFANNYLCAWHAQQEGYETPAAPDPKPSLSISSSTAADVSTMRSELLQEIDDAIQGTPYWQGGRLDTVKYLLARVEKTEAEAVVHSGEWCAENRAAGRGPCGACAWCCKQATERAEVAESLCQMDQYNDKMLVRVVRVVLDEAAKRAEAFDPDSDTIGSVIRALDVRGIIAQVRADQINQGSTPEGPPAAPAGSTEGERRQDAGAAGSAETACFSPLRAPESTGPAPTPDPPMSVVVAVQVQGDGASAAATQVDGSRSPSSEELETAHEDHEKRMGRG